MSTSDLVLPDALLPRWAEHITVDANGCWIWTRGTCMGYAWIYVDKERRQVYGHRLAYELAHGPIPAELEIDHLCRVRACVNPAHLEAVTHAENVRRGEAGRNMREKTHCPQGHPYEDENMYVYPKRNGFERRCRACHIERMRAMRRAQGAVAKGTATHCKYGHAYAEHGRVRGGASESAGRRYCYQCAKDRAEERKAA